MSDLINLRRIEERGQCLVIRYSWRGKVRDVVIHNAPILDQVRELEAKAMRMKATGLYEDFRMYQSLAWAIEDNYVSAGRTTKPI